MIPSCYAQPKKPRQGWDEAFKQAITYGDKPKDDLFEGMKNKFDDTIKYSKKCLNIKGFTSA